MENLKNLKFKLYNLSRTSVDRCRNIFVLWVFWDSLFQNLLKIKASTTVSSSNVSKTWSNCVQK